MSDRARRTSRLGRTGCTTLALALLAALIAGPRAAEAQSDVEALQRLRAQAESAQVRATIADSIFRAGAARAFNMSIDTLRAAGLELLITPALESARDRERLAEGLERGRSALRARWGSSAEAMIDTSIWRLSGPRGRFSALQPLRFSSGPNGRQALMDLRRPIDPARVERFLLQHAGVHVVRAIPLLEGYAGTQIPLHEPAAIYENAARELALSWSSPARRCYGGSIPDCRRILSDPPEARRLETWYDAADHRALVAAHAGELARTDTVRHGMRVRCNDGDDAECTKLAHTFPAIRFPLSTNPRATFVSFAISRADSAAFARLRAVPGDGPGDVVASLADALGTPEDSLIAEWRERAHGVLARSRPPALPLVAGTAFWSLLLLGISTRRRPS